MKLTVIIRDPAPMVHMGESPTHRTVVIELTEEQASKIQLKKTSNSPEMFEEISMCILEES